MISVGPSDRDNPSVAADVPDESGICQKRSSEPGIDQRSEPGDLRSIAGVNAAVAGHVPEEANQVHSVVGNGRFTSWPGPRMKSGMPTTTEFNGAADWVYVADRWPAVVDRQTWDRAQELLAGNRRNTSPCRDYLFSGLLKCQCGCKTSMHGHKQRTASKRYHCTGCGATASEAELLEQVTAAIRWEYSTDRLQELRQAMERKLRSRSKQQQNGADTKPIKAKLQRYEKRLLEVDSDMVAVVQAEIRSLRQQLSEAERQGKAVVQSTGDMQKRIDRALADFFRLLGDRRWFGRVRQGDAQENSVLHRGPMVIQRLDP